MDLLERELAVADLTQCLDTAARREGCIALVGGEAGIGKTALLQEFAKGQQQARLLWGACDSLFTPRPLAPLHDIARQTQGALLQALAGNANRDLIFAATLDELEHAPSIVVFEDMHWADEATLDLVKFLGRRIQRTRTLLVLSYRDDEVGSRHPLRFVIGDLPRAATHRMLLAPLSQAATALLAGRSGRCSQELYSITGGNPLFVTELMATGCDNVPVTVRDAVLARAAMLTPAARELAEFVSIIPGKTESWLLASDSPDEACIDSCVSNGMVRDADGSLAFRHELTRRALEDSLSQPRQQGLHARVLAAMKAHGDVSAARLTHHADGARNATDVLHYAPIAATQAALVGAHREAAAHYRVALRYAMTLAPQDRALLHEQLSYECYLTDQIEPAIEARRAALAVWRESGSALKEGDTLRWLSRLSWFAGQRKIASQLADEAITVLATLPAGRELAMAYSNRAQLDMLEQNAAPAIAWAQRAIDLAEAFADTEVLSHALNNKGTARISGGDLGGRLDLEHSLRIALAGGLHEHAARAYTNLASTAIGNREYMHASRYLHDGIAYCEERDLDSWRLYMRAWSARANLEQGHWQKAGEEADAVLQDSRTAAVTRVPALTVVGHLRVRRGDPDAMTPLEAARTGAGTINELQRIAPLAAAFADAAWLAGDLERVVREVEPAYELAQQRHDPWAKGELATWLWRANALEQQPAGIAQPYALEIAGDWRGAANAWLELGCPYEYAGLLARHGSEDEQLQALAKYEALGATPAAQALRKQMRSNGVRRIPRGLRVSTRNNSLGLTKREAEILALLAEGLRNAEIATRLFLSTKTVDHHVSAILTKLDVPSRAAAVALARRRTAGTA